MPIFPFFTTESDFVDRAINQTKRHFQASFKIEMFAWHRSGQWDISKKNWGWLPGNLLRIMNSAEDAPFSPLLSSFLSGVCMWWLDLKQPSCNRKEKNMETLLWYYWDTKPVPAFAYPRFLMTWEKIFILFKSLWFEFSPTFCQN